MVGAEFFQRDPLRCARDLVGCELRWGACAGIIVETEAYHAVGDEACHTFFKPSTRAFVERNRAGAAYIYLNYGMHWMLNVLVKGNENGFVLIRALEPTRGLALMKRRRAVTAARALCSGPGKLTQALAITQRHHEMDLCADARFCFAPSSADTIPVRADVRIGISRAAKLPWRFTLRDSEYVSVPFRSRRPRW
ncbi:MAG: DNA-3-methyladenine glycosylase [Verrucomicrobiota bacterium]|nr:DNA-3-methyladenine glycosylase [Verrucomicrobiota bacterium]